MPGGTRQYLKAHGITPRKSWGQNFLVGPSLPERLVQGWDLQPGTGVFEIGAGAGALTAPLLECGAPVLAVERDRRLCGLLRDRFEGTFGPDRFRLIEGDILTLDPARHLTAMPGVTRWVVVGNLPYAITTPILEWAIAFRKHFAWLAVMVQREYGARMAARPGTSAYGSLTLWAGYHFRIQKEMAVGASHFWPMPKVESVVLRLTPWESPPVEVPSAEAFERVVRAAFAHRRKMIGGSLERGLGLSREEVHAILRSAGLDPRLRAEQCDANALAALTRAWAERE